MKCIVACYQPWRQIIAAAYSVSTGGLLLLVTAGFLLPSLRRFSLSPGRSMTVLVLGSPPDGVVLRQLDSRESKGSVTVRHRVRTGKLNPLLPSTQLPALVPGEARRPAHLVVLETSRNKAHTCGTVASVYRPARRETAKPRRKFVAEFKVPGGLQDGRLV